jgi:hypothetical protein
MLKREATRRAIERLCIPACDVSIFHRVKKDNAGGFHLFLKLRTGIDLEELQKFEGKMAVALKCDRVEFQQVSSNTVLMSATRKLSKNLPLKIERANSSLLPKQAEGVAIGVDSRGDEFKLEIFGRDGGRSTLIGGNPNQGKSSLLKIIASGFSDSSTAIIWFDPKFGADARLFSGRVDVYDNPNNPEEYLSALQSLQNIAQSRNHFLGQGFSIQALPRILLIIDEWAVLAGLGPKHFQTEFGQTLRKLVATSRSANIAIVLATQRPTKDNIDVTTRELSANRIAFQVGDIYASEAILGVSGAERNKTLLSQGHCLVWKDGFLVPVALFRVDSEMHEKASSNSGLKLTIPNLQEMNRVFEREHRYFGGST